MEEEDGTLPLLPLLEVDELEIVEGETDILPFSLVVESGRQGSTTLAWN